MILIADSGSTKTDWRFVSEDGIMQSCTSAGINPALQTLHDIKEEQLAVLQSFTHLPVKQIDFYGAGCGQTASQSKIEEMLNTVFPSVEINVSSDLLGAARAIFDHRPGIACILGTGSNSGYYDGKKITENVPSLGYLLGDEGGGSQIGKQLLTDYLRANMPDHISDLLRKEIGNDRAVIYDRIYQSSFPNRFLASIVGIVSLKHANDAYFREVIYKEFDRFFVNCIDRYEIEKDVSLGFVGSLAFHFRDLLKLVSENHGITISGIVEKPIDSLANQYFKESSNKLFSKTSGGL